MGLIPVAAGDIAAIVTTLEMRDRPRPRPMPATPLRLVKWVRPDLDNYRTLFRRVGARWLWYSRLTMPDERLIALIHDPATEIYAVIDRAGIEVGMVELNFRKADACEIAYFALIPELTGQRHGRWMMAETLARAWRPGVNRVWLHSCTLDHPSAINFYRACGFVAVSRTIETFADPRLIGVLPVDAAPQIPLLDAETRQ